MIGYDKTTLSFGKLHALPRAICNYMLLIRGKCMIGDCVEENLLVQTHLTFP